jgi:hypothetical protein
MKSAFKHLPPIVEIRKLTDLIRQRAEEILPTVTEQIEGWDGKGRLHIPITTNDDVLAVIHQEIRKKYPGGNIYVFRPNA